MPPHPSTNFEVQNFNEFIKGSSSRNNLPEIKDVVYIINLEEYKSTEIHWIALHVKSDNVTYSDNFGVEHIHNKTKNFIDTRFII